MQLIRPILTVFVVQLLACSSVPTPPAVTQLPFPDDKQPAAVTNMVQDGRDSYQRSTGASEAGTSLDLVGGSSGAEWAVYRFTPTVPFTITYADINFVSGLTDQAWVGLANFTTKRWEFSGPHSASVNITADNESNLSPAGNVYLAVVVAEGGQARIDWAILTVEGSRWDAVVVDSDPGSGKNSSLAVVAGYPAIAYTNDFDFDLRYVHATDSDGANWGPPVVVDDTEYVLSASLEVVNGMPAIAYAKGNTELCYIRALDPEGNTWGAPVVVTMNAFQVELKVVNGQPAIAVYDGDLKFVRASDANGMAWGTPQLLDGATSDVGDSCSLQLVDGRPAIAYHDNDSNDLKYIYAVDSDGASWSAPLVLDSSGDVGLQCSLSLINETPGPTVPAIAYRDDTNYKVKFIRAADVTGSTWESPQTVDPLFYGGFFTSLTSSSGVPVIGYFYYGVNLVSAIDPQGLDWEEPQVADAGNNTGWAISLAEVNLQPAMSYYDFTGSEFNEGQLKYVRRY